MRTGQPYLAAAWCRHHLHSWKEFFVLMLLAAVYFGLLRLFERLCPTWEDWEIRIVSGISIVIIGLITLSVFRV